AVGHDRAIGIVAVADERHGLAWLRAAGRRDPHRIGLVARLAGAVVVAPFLLEVVVAAVDRLVPRGRARAAERRSEVRDAQVPVLVARTVRPSVRLGIGDDLVVLVTDRRDRRIGGAAIGPRV